MQPKQNIHNSDNNYRIFEVIIKKNAKNEVTLLSCEKRAQCYRTSNQRPSASNLSCSCKLS